MCKSLETSAGILLLKALIASRLHCSILLELFWNGYSVCKGPEVGRPRSDVLGLTGIELIFSIVACMWLCFGFVSITQGCFSYC